jgi:mono/diheme cytochrome c family protein
MKKVTSAIRSQKLKVESRRRAISLNPFCLLLSAFCLLVSTGCRQDMHVQPKYKSLDPSSFFDDGRSARPVVPGTVARDQLRTDEGYYTGKVNGVEVATFPFPITREVLEHGRERYNIYCTPCHDRLGEGQGMIVQRGFPPPPSYHTDRLRQAPVGHFYNVITNGYGTMYNYASRITPQDRWAIAAYIRALQLSQAAKLSDLTDEDRRQLQGQQGQQGTEQSPAAGTK